MSVGAATLGAYSASLPPPLRSAVSATSGVEAMRSGATNFAAFTVCSKLKGFFLSVTSPHAPSCWCSR